MVKSSKGAVNVKAKQNVNVNQSVIQGEKDVNVEAVDGDVNVTGSKGKR